MGELRLVPAALAVWAGAACCILVGAWAGALAVAVLCAVALALREPGQALLTAGLGAAAVATAGLRVRAAAAWEFGRARAEVAGTLSGPVKRVASGAYLANVSVPGYPAPVPVFAEALPPGAVSGARVVATGTLGESARAGVNPYTVNGGLEVVGPPQGLAAFAQHVRSTFAAVVEAKVGPSSQGLIPGMVLGDVSLQSVAEQQAYVDTGLSHLSAVSGANIAVVTSFAAVAAAAVGLGLRGRLACSAAALLLYAGLVGPEPSVLRASVSGLVGLVAVLASRQSEPVHALCLSVIGLVLVDSDLAVHFGFALSVAATAGIVALFPFLYRALAVTRWPDILVRALAVAVAADAATAPIVALMAGRVSLVSVAANVLVAPVAGAVTVLGLAAATLCLVPGGLETPLLRLVEPLTWWVHTVARVGASLPGATVEAGPLAVLVAYGWIAAGLAAGRVRLTAGAACAACALAAVAGLGVAALPGHHARPVDTATLRAYVVDTKDDVEPVPPGTQLVVVLEGGAPHARPVATRGGIPVIFPNRDGPVVLYSDGTQRLGGGGA